jgi:uncharacterized protein (TIGR03382 family)
MTDPALDQVAYTLLAGTGVAIAAVLVLLGVYRLVRRRPQPHPLPVDELAGSTEQPEPVAAEGPEVEVPTPRDPAEAPAEEVVAAEPHPRKVPA